jgi:hypothetical protein
MQSCFLRKHFDVNVKKTTRGFRMTNNIKAIAEVKGKI